MAKLLSEFAALKARLNFFFFFKSLFFVLFYTLLHNLISRFFILHFSIYIFVLMSHGLTKSA